MKKAICVSHPYQSRPDFNFHLLLYPIAVTDDLDCTSG